MKVSLRALSCVRMLVLMIGCISTAIGFAADMQKANTLIITPSTRDASLLHYYHRISASMQESASRNWPTKNGQKIHGNATASIPISRDGSLYMKEGGPRIESSSGSRDIDRIVRLVIQETAPYAPFSQGMDKDGGHDVLLVLITFTFAH